MRICLKVGVLFELDEREKVQPLISYEELYTRE